MRPLNEAEYNTLTGGAYIVSEDITIDSNGAIINVEKLRIFGQLCTVTSIWNPATPTEGASFFGAMLSH